MSIKDMISKFGVAHGHDEPIGALDRLGGHTDPPASSTNTNPSKDRT